MASLSRVLHDPTVMRRLHGWATVLWALLAPPSMLWWRDSIPYLVGLSVYACAAGHFSSWQACRTEALVGEQISSDKVSQHASDKNPSQTSRGQ